MKVILAGLLATATLIQLVHAGGSLSLSECKASTNGQSWWTGLVQKQCRYSHAKSEIILIACKTPTKGTKLSPGGDARDGDFHFECRGDEKALELVVKHCYLPKGGAAIMVGMKAKGDGGEYHCITQDKKGVKTVTRTFAKVAAGCEIDGKRLKIGQTHIAADKLTRLQCRLRKGSGVMFATGCKLPNGKVVSYWTAHSGFFCQPVYGNTMKSDLIKKDLTCKDNKNKDVNVFGTWKVGLAKYRCEYTNLNLYKKDVKLELRVKPMFYSCYKKINYKDKDGKSKTYTFGVTRNYQSRARDGNFYRCNLKTDKKTGEKYGEMIQLTIKSCTCTIGNVSWFINEYKVIDGVRYKCSWRTKGAINYVKDCQSENNKKVRVGKNLDMGSYGMTCVRGKGVVVWRRMTDAEYAAWMSGDNNAVSALGGGGAGEGRDNEHNIKCEKGFKVFEQDGKKACKDIDECLVGGHDCDSDNERCKNTVGAWKCLCKIGEVRRSDNEKCEVLVCPPCAG